VSALDIELGGVTFTARLLTDRAPRTCAALLKAVPFSGRAVHSTWSGNMIHTLDELPLDVNATEAPVGFQYPGLVTYSPSRRELSVCYGDARYRHSAGPEYVTPVAEIQGDLGPVIEVAARLQFEGATPIALREGTAEVVPAEPEVGAKVEVDLDGVVVTATLLESSAPRTCEAFKALLPLEGPATNTKWSGEMAHFWGGTDEVARAGRGPIGLHVEPQENPTPFHAPGYIYYHPAYGGIRICYGDGQQSGAFSVSRLTALARFDGDWSAFREKARQLIVTGVRPMRIRLKAERQAERTSVTQ
jgi:hypothetical protein